MNATKNDLFINNELIYQKLGSSWFLDSAYMFLLAPVSFMAIFLNMISFIILTKIKVKTNTNIYEYLKVYSIISCLLCVSYGLMFLNLSPRYLGFIYNYLIRFYRCILYFLVASSLYTISNILDVLIAIERLSVFIVKLQPFIQYSPIKITILFSIASILINFPMYFSFYVKDDQEYEVQFKNVTNNLKWCFPRNLRAQKTNNNKKT